MITPDLDIEIKTILIPFKYFLSMQSSITILNLFIFIVYIDSTPSGQSNGNLTKLLASLQVPLSLSCFQGSVSCSYVGHTCNNIAVFNLRPLFEFFMLVYVSNIISPYSNIRLLGDIKVLFRFCTC